MKLATAELSPADFPNTLADVLEQIREDSEVIAARTGLACRQAALVLDCLALWDLKRDEP